MLTAGGRILRSAAARCLTALAVLASGTHAVHAQETPPRIGPYVVDLHGIAPKFGDSAELAASRDLSQAELPGLGLGVSAGAHYYFPKLVGITFGVGGEVMIARSHSEPPGPTIDPTTGVSTPSTLRPVTEVLRSFSPQLSLNFGSGKGWSYLSVGFGRSQWSIIPEGADPRPVDEEVIRTITYGGGGRWFIKRHLAFSLDVRFYEIDEGTATLAFPGSPRALLLVIGAGISVR